MEKTTARAVPFFRPSITDAEIREVVACLESGWLTTGSRCRQFESDFANAVNAQHALALNSCTAALHVAVAALGLRAGQAVLVPTMTFAATAEVVRYLNAYPILVDCDPVTLNIDLNDAEAKLRDLRAGKLPVDPAAEVVGIMPVHYGGLMLDMDEVRAFADRHGLWVVEDAAHSFPAAYRKRADAPWRSCGENTADVTCFSFYANKTITTGEGGMATTNSKSLVDAMRMLSLHGLSHDAWKRYSGGSSWDYHIVAPGYKYNLTDIAASIGIVQVRRAEELRQQRAAVAHQLITALADNAAVELPPVCENRVHSWHLFSIRLREDQIQLSRNEVVDQLRLGGVGCSVHWRPLHLHPYYVDTMKWRPEHLPTATAIWTRLVTLPCFPGMTDAEIDHVVTTLLRILKA